MGNGNDTNQAISSYDIDSLRNYFLNDFKKPFFHTWFNYINDIPDDVLKSDASFGKLKKLALKATKKNRYRMAAWFWLEPRHQCRNLDDLDTIKAIVQLNDVSKETLVSNITEHIKEFLVEHKIFSLWINKRLSLLEYLTNRNIDALNESLRDVSFKLRYSLLNLFSVFCNNPDESTQLAKKIASQALQASAQCVSNVLTKGSKAPPTSANLMLPMLITNPNKTNLYVKDKAVQINSEAADKLWEDYVDIKDRLVVVAQTDDAFQLGFWVPMVRGSEGAYIPGAPKAYGTMQGDAVFMDDLPPMPGFAAGCEAKWRKYVREQLSGTMFVSIPFIVPELGSTVENKLSVAVLNVNADIQSHDEWRRAYHPEWLDIAIDAVGQYVEIAYWAALVLINIEHTKNPDLPKVNSSSSLWNKPPNIL